MLAFFNLGGIKLELRANIIEKRGTLQVVITYKDITGNRKQRWRDTKLKKKGNKKRAEKIKDEFLEEIEKELIKEEADSLDIFNTSTKDMTFYDYLEDYLNVVKVNVSYNTYIGYKKYVKNRINHFFAKSNILLKDLKPFHLQKFYQSMLDDGLKANSVIHYHAYIRKALQDAVISELVPFNVADRVKKPRRQQFIQQTYNSEEVLRLLEVTKTEKLHLVILMTVFYGLRRSEVLGLKWDAIDFVHKKLSIRHVVLENSETKSEVLKENKTKTNSSYRTLPLVEEIEKALLKQAEWQQNNRNLFGSEYEMEDSDYIFTMENGLLMRPNYVSQRFARIIRRNKLKHIRFHDLRHSNASIMLDNGRNMKEIQEWLGHESYTTTANLYTHLISNFKEGAASSLESAFGFSTKKDK